MVFEVDTKALSIKHKIKCMRGILQQNTTKQKLLKRTGIHKSSKWHKGKQQQKKQEILMKRNLSK